ncbi:MAG: Rpn family recombination-promoting nuclease/putative transposase, partial [Leptonema sp. (in: Bacteria)]|nr:Rpn family recombination-promoting nuclease/putative transposase [Leptonema sp. (in: bacteria)]
MLQQLLNYQKEAYARQTKYSPIVPVVFYHGKQKWNIRTSFAQLESEDLLPYTLNFSYILINLQEVDLTKIKLSLTSLAILHIFSQIWEVGKVEKLDQYIRFIEDVILRDSNDKLFKLILMYI